MNAGSDRRSQSERFGIYRNTKCGLIAGVCAGIADRVGIKTIWVRAAFIALAAVSHCIAAVILYIVLVLVLRPRSVDFGYASAPYPAGSPGYFADRFYGGGNPMPGPAGPPPGSYQTSPYQNGPAPGGRLADAAARFAALDARLNSIEAAVMSDEISLRRKFRDLGG